MTLRSKRARRFRGLAGDATLRTVVDGYRRGMSVYVLNLVDRADNADYLAYSRRSPDTVARHGGEVVALGRHVQHPARLNDTAPREALVPVQWRDREAFDAFLADPDLHGLHPLCEKETTRYVWWMFDRLDDLRPLSHR